MNIGELIQEKELKKVTMNPGTEDEHRYREVVNEIAEITNRTFMSVRAQLQRKGFNKEKAGTLEEFVRMSKTKKIPGAWLNWAIKSHATKD